MRFHVLDDVLYIGILSLLKASLIVYMDNLCKRGPASHYRFAIRKSLNLSRKEILVVADPAA